ncbi:MAG: glycosyltransferase family 2 protein [Lachnospiraceae bacterium]|nr:glycosyltransferase family 2 protein [Lachnospiraceae bacterium]
MIMLRIIEVLLTSYLLYNLVKIPLSYKKIIHLKSSIEGDFPGKERFLMIIPVFKEQERIAKCIENIERLDWEAYKLDVCICTTQKEPVDGKDTQTILEKVLTNEKLKYHYEIVRYPFTDGNMAEQVNYAYSQVERKYDIICIYNADSMPERASIRYADICFRNKQIDYVQQRAIYSNYYKNNIFSIGYSIYQSIFEINKNLIKDINNNGENVVGRALYIRKSAINDKIYPTDFFCEDMALSFELIERNKKITTIPCFEINEPPPRLRDIINQQYVWFHTALKVKEITKYVMNRFNCTELSLNTKKKAFRRIIDNIIWIATSPLMLLITICDIRYILCMYCYAVVLVLAVDICFKVRKYKTILFDAFCWVLYLFVLSLGPIKCLGKKFTMLFRGKEPDVKYKTPRGKGQ